MSRILKFPLILNFVASSVILGMLLPSASANEEKSCKKHLASELMNFNDFDDFYTIEEKPLKRAFWTDKDQFRDIFDRSVTGRDFRLPMNVYPNSYDIALQPHMYTNDTQDFFVNGSVTIDTTCVRSTKEVVLHGHLLHIDENSVIITQKDNKSNHWTPDIILDTDNQFLILKSSRGLIQGLNYTIQISFQSKLVQGHTGLFYREYSRENKTVFVVASHMEPTYARMVIPCFDEPAIKAQFRTTLIRKTHMISVSNTHIINQTFRDDGWVEDHYELTPKMSTYLLAFVVCDFSFSVEITKYNISYRAFTHQDDLHKIEFALNEAVLSTTFYEEYFENFYPLPITDMIGISNFHGAMENWGLIVYGERYMMYDPTTSSVEQKQTVSTFVCHEVAHQWFGNLVSPSWWDDTWLNEGFATYFGISTSDILHPQWQMMDLFASKEMRTVLQQDGELTSHPISFNVSYRRIREAFDVISYQKGASVIRMMHFILGEETFRQGLQRYLRDNAYSSVNRDTLWYSFGNQSVIDSMNNEHGQIKEVMDTWILQMNYPLVTMARQGTNLTLQQSRYLNEPTANYTGEFESPFDYKWEVPFTYTTKTRMHFNQTKTDIVWLRRDGSEVVLPNVLSEASDDWYIGNVMRYGPYRVNYPNENWIGLIEQLKEDHTKIHRINRAQIIDDAWSLFRSGQLGLAIVLRTTEYLLKEEMFIPHYIALQELKIVETMLERTDSFSLYANFMRETYTEILNKIGMDYTGTNLMDTLLSATAVSLSCKFGNEDCIRNATDLFKVWIAKPETEIRIQNHFRRVIYCIAIQYGAVEDWEIVFQKYKQSTSREARIIYASALACSTEKAILSRYLNYTFIKDESKYDLEAKIFMAVSKNPVGLYVAWNFLMENWDFIQARHGNGLNLLKKISARFKTESELKMLKDFGSEIFGPSIEDSTFQKAVKKVNENIKWIAENFEIVKVWLTQINEKSHMGDFIL